MLASRMGATRLLQLQPSLIADMLQAMRFESVCPANAGLLEAVLGSLRHECMESACLSHATRPSNISFTAHSLSMSSEASNVSGQPMRVRLQQFAIGCGIKVWSKQLCLRPSGSFKALSVSGHAAFIGRPSCPHMHRLTPTWSICPSSQQL